MIPNWFKTLLHRVNEIRGTGWFSLLLIAAILGGLVYQFLPRKSLDILVHPEDQAGDSKDIGLIIMVRRGDVAADKAQVWAVASDGRGYRVWAAATTSPAPGEYLVRFPRAIGGRPLISAEVHAITGGASAAATVELAGSTQPKAIVFIVVGLGSVLLVSLLLPFFGHCPGRARYVVSMALAVLFSFWMVANIAIGLSSIERSSAADTAGRRTAPLRLGFLSVFEGTYVEGGSTEWLISLSAPPPAAPEPGKAPSPVTGFGAPLWVVLVSALGASILTVSLVVNEITGGPGDNADAIRTRMHNAVEHQVFILFAPVVSIFVYQTMVITKTANQDLTVAIGALGAGAALNSLLKYAVDTGGKLFTRPAGDEVNQTVPGNVHPVTS